MSRVSKNLNGGDLMSDVKNMVIPFGLLLAKNGVDYMAKAKKAPKPKVSKPKAKVPSSPKKAAPKRGGCGACANKALVGGQASSKSVSRNHFEQELANLARDLRNIIKEYAS